MSIIWFLILFAILVVSHEFGHYIIGKNSGIRVKEFMVGMGPAIFKKQKGDTLFSIRLLPMGGACIFDGMLDDPDAEESVMDEHSFPNANVWKRIATVLAGPLANFLIAFIFAVILVACCGVDRSTISEVVPDSAAQEAGLLPGDRIVKMDHESIHLYREISMNSFLFQGGKSMDITYERDGERYTVTLVPKYSEEDGRYYIGIRGGNDIVSTGPLETFLYGFYEIRYCGKYVYKTLGMLLSGKLGVDTLSGPVGMADFVDDTYQDAKSYGVTSVILTMMNLLVLLSVNLGIMNLLPIPALDGGRLLLLVIEVIRGKKIPPEKEGLVTIAGVIFLILLMIVVMYNDVARLLGFDILIKGH